jgi:DNA-binding CsgD family transcriptional regulator
MPVQQTITSRDVGRLLAVTDRARHTDDDLPMPWSVLHDVQALIPAVSVCYSAFDPYRRLQYSFRYVLDGSQVTDTDLPGPDDPSWGEFWAWDCSRPERSRDFVSVIPGSAIPLEPAAAAAQRRRALDDGLEFDVVVPLRPHGTVSYRLLLWREPGRDFSDRELTLLRLARPHLVEIHEEYLSRATPGPALTERQQEVMRLVAAGLTNAQIARRLQISADTVRKHLENIYATLGVTHRLAAVACVTEPGFAARP